VKRSETVTGSDSDFETEKQRHLERVMVRHYLKVKDWERRWEIVRDSDWVKQKHSDLKKD